MGDLRSAFLSKDFVVNSNIVKCIGSLDISLEEFLLVLYFLNVSPILDIDDIKDKLGFDEEKITDTFSKLLNKKYIDLLIILRDKYLNKFTNDIYEKVIKNCKSKEDAEIYMNDLKDLLFNYEFWFENKTPRETKKQ